MNISCAAFVVLVAFTPSALAQSPPADDIVKALVGRLGLVAEAMTAASHPPARRPPQAGIACADARRHWQARNDSLLACGGLPENAPMQLPACRRMSGRHFI